MPAAPNSFDTVQWGNPVNWNHPLNRGLLTWWALAPNRCGWGGLTVMDLCRRLNGTVTGATWKPRQQWPTHHSAGLNFATAGTDKVDFGDATLFDGLTAVSIAFTITCDDATNAANDSRILGKWGGTAAQQCFLVAQAGTPATGILFAAHENNTPERYTIKSAASVLSSAVPTRIVVTWIGGATATFAVYKDGVVSQSVSDLGSTGTQPSSLANSTSSILLGKDPDANGMLGGLSDIKIWNRALTATDAAEENQLTRRGHVGLLNRWSQMAYSVPVADTARGYVIGAGFANILGG